MKKPKIYPSLLSCDFAHLAKDIKRLQEAGADGFHLDIMDGHFVPNLSFGPAFVAAVNRSTELFLDVHLMMYSPFDYIEKFVEAGADLISFHFEATENVEDTLEYIKKCGKKAFLAFNPKTSLELAIRFMPLCDGFLFMAVEPGFAGQKFQDSVVPKICRIHELRQKNRRQDFLLQVDGGIDPDTALKCVKAGADIVVSGSYLFSEKTLPQAISKLKGL